MTKLLLAMHSFRMLIFIVLYTLLNHFINYSKPEENTALPTCTCIVPQSTSTPYHPFFNRCMATFRCKDYRSNKVAQHTNTHLYFPQFQTQSRLL